MEDSPRYQIDSGGSVYVRAECFLRADKGWEVPSRDEVLTVIRRAGLDIKEAADFLGTSRKQVNKWTTGNENILFSCWVLLCQKARIAYLDGWL